MQSLYPCSHELVSLASGRMPFMFFVFLYLGFGLNVAAQSGNKPPETLIRDGQTALDAGDFSRAIQQFEKAEQLSPDNPDANRGLVLSYLHAGRLLDAQRIAEPAVERWPRDAQLLHLIGLVYFKQGQKQKALQTLQRSESLRPSSSDIHFDIALVHLSQDQYPPAAVELEAAIKLDPN